MPGGRERRKKPTTVLGRGYSSESSELSTSPGRAVGYDDDNQQTCLPKIALHAAHTNPSATAPASSKTGPKKQRNREGVRTDPFTPIPASGDAKIRNRLTIAI